MGQAASQSVVSSPATPAQCPIDHSAAKAAPAKCPISHDKPATSSSSAAPAQCPISHEQSSKPAQCPTKHESGGINPLNQMPTLSQMPAEQQLAALPVERETSTIPRDDGSRWEYPSPQQFYNALVRKGWETPEEHVETMVQIHNFLNEQAWQEILKWERKEYPYVFGTMLIRRLAYKRTTFAALLLSHSLHASRDVLESCRQRLASGSLRDGCFRRDSSAYLPHP